MDTTDTPKPKTQHRLSGIWPVVLAVVVIGGGIWLWDDVIKDRVIPKRWGVVEEGSVYRSGRLSSSLVKRMLEKHHIQMILALEGEVPENKDQAAEVQAAEELGIELKRFPLGGDGTGNIEVYADAVATMATAVKDKKPVLVHCAAGSQRTGGAVAFYRLLVQQRPPTSVIDEMLEYDHDPKRNPALLKYINENMGQMATLLQAKGVIDAVPESLPVLPAP